jgi:hypothetical protein
VDGDLAGAPLGVQQARGGPMGRITLAGVHRGLQRGAHHRMHHPHRVAGHQDLEPLQTSGERCRSVHLDPRDLRRLAQLATIAEHGHGAREGEGARVGRLHARDHAPCDLVVHRQRFGAAPVAAGAARKLARVERIAAAGFVHRAARRSSTSPPSVARTTAPVPSALSSGGRTTADAAARTATRAGSLDAGSSGRRTTTSATASPSSRRARYARAQRRLVGPVSVVDGDEERPAAPPGSPSPSTAHGSRRRTCRRPPVGRRAAQQRRRRPRGTGERFRANVRDRALEQLADDPNAKPASSSSRSRARHRRPGPPAGTPPPATPSSPARRRPP